MMKPWIEWDMRLCAPSHRLTRTEQARLASALRRALKKKVKGEVSVAFVSPAIIRRLNRTYRHKDKTTDVLSFRLDPLLAEVLICYAQAKKQAGEHGRSVKTELIDLVVHGILHAFGFDHETDKDAKRMLPLQAKIMESVC